MKPALFIKLIEKDLINTTSKVGVEYNVYENFKKVKTIKGLYQVKRIYPHPLMLNWCIDVENEKETVTIEPKDIKLLNGLPPLKAAATKGIRPDGREEGQSKRRGRKPKVKVIEHEFSADDFDEYDEED